MVHVTVDGRTDGQGGGGLCMWGGLLTHGERGVSERSEV